jgi:hypothetical protein
MFLTLITLRLICYDTCFPFKRKIDEILRKSLVFLVPPANFSREVGILVDDLVLLDMNSLLLAIKLGQGCDDADGVTAPPQGMIRDDLNQVSETGSQSFQAGCAAVTEGETLGSSGG